MGRHQFAIDPPLLAKVEALAAQGLTEKQICQVIGCSQETLIKKKKIYSELVDAIKNGRAKGVATITNALFNNAKGGNIAAQIFFLCNRDPENWKRHDKPEESDESNKPTPVAVNINVSDASQRDS